MYSNHFYEEATLIFGSCCQLAKEPNGDSVTIIIKDQTACQKVPKIYIQSISSCVKTSKKALRDLSSFFFQEFEMVWIICLIGPIAQFWEFPLSFVLLYWYVVSMCPCYCSEVWKERSFLITR